MWVTGASISPFRICTTVRKLSSPMSNSGWNTLILVWVGLALAGVTVSVLGTLKWRKRKESPEAEQTE